MTYITCSISSPTCCCVTRSWKCSKFNSIILVMLQSISALTNRNQCFEMTLITKVRANVVWSHISYCDWTRYTLTVTIICPQGWNITSSFLSLDQILQWRYSTTITSTQQILLYQNISYILHEKKYVTLHYII